MEDRLQGHPTDREGQDFFRMAVDHALDVRIPLVDFRMDVPLDEAPRGVLVDGRAIDDTILDEICRGPHQRRRHLAGHQKDIRLFRVAD